MTSFENPPAAPQPGGAAWTGYPREGAGADNAWRDELAKPELQLVEALDEFSDALDEASREGDASLARALGRWPEPGWWHTLAGILLSGSGLAAGTLGLAAFTAEHPVAVTADSVVSTLLVTVVPLALGASSLLRKRATGLGHTSLNYRAFLVGLALVLPVAMLGMLSESWATPAMWALVPLAATLGAAAVTGWRFSRPADR